MPINPVQFAHSICDEFLRYIFSAFPITDPDLATQARQKLRGKTSLDIPLVQGPFVSLSEAFAKGESVQAMADRGLLHPIMPGLIGYPSMWLHQQQVFEAVKAGQHVLVATGTHRDNTREELGGMLGKEIVQRFKVVNHHCQDDKIMVDLGKTSGGIPVVINRLFWEAEVKIVTATIAPHQGAGFSGGRKSVLPGIASLATLKQHHGFGMRSNRPAMGWVEGNKFHENALEAAKMAKVDFILNTVQNDHKEITQVVAGDVEKAWFEGVKASREIFEVKVPHPVDIVITTPGGFPKDIDLYQSQKSMASSELVVKEGGTVILLAECKDGVGAHGFYEWMSAATCPQEVIDRFIREGYSIGASKAWLFSRCLKRSDLILVSKHIEDKTLKEMFTKGADTVDRAIQMALAKHGQNAEIILLKNGSDMIPRFEGR